MFASFYPATKLKRLRLLQWRRQERDVAIQPKGRPALPPPERVHANSCIVVSPIPGKVMVVEWTGTTVEQHDVDL